MFPWQHRVRSEGVTIAVHATGEPRGDAPVALCCHGTSYVAQVWAGVVPRLATGHVVVAIDRRGHGLSDQPDAAYDFMDFARDACAVIDALNLQQALGVGHSAGATDLLLAAAERPRAFARIVAIEPTVMEPLPSTSNAPLGAMPAAVLEKVLRRRDRFPSRDAALAHLRTKPAFLGWREDVLRAFVEHGLVQDGDQVMLRCRPRTEAAMLEPIFRVMEGSYRDSRIFDALHHVPCPVHLIACQRSPGVYEPMLRAAERLLPNHHRTNIDANHCLAQLEPELFATLLGC